MIPVPVVVGKNIKNAVVQKNRKNTNHEIRNYFVGQLVDLPCFFLLTTPLILYPFLADELNSDFCKNDGLEIYRTAVK